MNIGYSGSNSLMSRTAIAGLTRPWKSMPISTLLPTASRSEAIDQTKDSGYIQTVYGIGYKLEGENHE